MLKEPWFNSIVPTAHGNVRVVRLPALLERVGLDGVLGRTCFVAFGGTTRKDLGMSMERWRQLGWWRGVVGRVPDLDGMATLLSSELEDCSGLMARRPTRQMLLAREPHNVWVSRLDEKRPTCAEVAPLVSRLYSSPGCGAGCCLHIVLDDYNAEDVHVRYCYDYAVERSKDPHERRTHDLCVLLASKLLRMSVTQRLKLARGNKWPNPEPTTPLLQPLPPNVWYKVWRSNE